jgi:hypothetical protein
LIAGVGVLVAVKFMTQIAWPWYAIIGSLTTFAIGCLVSFILPESDQLDEL